MGSIGTACSTGSTGARGAAFRPHHQKASDVLVLLGRILGKHGAFGVPIGLGCGPGFLAS
jgi:hypothetical protein